MAEGDLQRVARPGALDVDRPGDRIDLAEVERLDALHRGAATKLAGGGVETLEMDRLAGPGDDRRLEVPVPAEMMPGAVDRVVAVNAHAVFCPD